MCFCVEQTHRELTESTFISDISVQYWRFYISKSWAYFIKLDQDLSLDPENFQIALKPAILQLHACNFVPSRASDRYLGQHLKFFGIKA